MRALLTTLLASFARCKNLSLVLLVGCITLSMSTSAFGKACNAKQEAKGKITVCHNTGSSKNPVVEICVNENAVSSHNANHEDYLQIAFFSDSDGDGFGDANAEAVLACVAPAGTVDNNDDCNDGDAAINPAANDNCNSLDMVDNNCDGIIDGGATDLFLDFDNDGDVSTVSTYSCDGQATSGTDCNDLDASIAGDGSISELACNTDNGFDGKDNDCDGITDPQGLLYIDNDADTFGAGALTSACPGAGYSSNVLDCDDNDPSVNPAAEEICGDGIDNNCDGEIDEGCSGGIFAIAYTDVDPNDGDEFKEEIDVLIAKLVDENGDGMPNAGDRIVTGQFPFPYWTSPSSGFASLNVTEHTGLTNCFPSIGSVFCNTASGGQFRWTSDESGSPDIYLEFGPNGFAQIQDNQDGGFPALYDYVWESSVPPSEPVDWVGAFTTGTSAGSSIDDAYIDVDVIYVP